MPARALDITYLLIIPSSIAIHLLGIHIASKHQRKRVELDECCKLRGSKSLQIMAHTSGYRQIRFNDGPARAHRYVDRSSLQ